VKSDRVSFPAQRAGSDKGTDQADGDSSHGGQPERPDTGPLVIGGRFRVVRALKSAHGVATLLTVDERDGGEAVLKTVLADGIPTGARLRLEHEARVLSELGGPGLSGLLDVGADGNLFYLAMPLLAGEPLSQRLQRGPLRAVDAIVIARDLTAALQTAHTHGVLHRDVKPSNIIVDVVAAGPTAEVDAGVEANDKTATEQPIASATLIDFGFARSPQLDAAVGDEPVGTARYVSPEQAGLLHHDVDERSDLYSVGVVIFECLAGRPPFTGKTVGEMLRAHLSDPAPELRSLGLDVPTALSQIVERLLRKDPDDRYQSAAAVLADIEELRACMDAGDTDPAITVGAHDHRPTLTEPAFVGRTDDLTALSDELVLTQAGRGGIVLVEAESGGGKSRLIEEFGRRCAQQGVWVLHGQGVDHAAARPFTLLDGVAHGVLARASHDFKFAARLHRELGDAEAAVQDALPTLQPVMQTSDREILGPEEHGVQRSLQALVRLFDALGDVDRPAVVLLDDCQWADELTVSLLRAWQQHGVPGNRHVLLVVAFRSEEVSEEAALRRTPGRCLRLRPFDDATVSALVESMAGVVPNDVLSLVQRLSAGSPFMASAVLRGLVESGALVHDGAGWTVERSLLARAQSSSEAATFLSRRLGLLGADSTKLLSAAAVLGKQFDIDAAAALAGLSGGAALAALVPARQRHIIWLDPTGAGCTFVHDKLRESLLASVSPEERVRLHRAAAAHLAASGEDRPYDLAFHYHSASDHAAALPYALSAATEARSRHALAVAEQQYLIALQGVDDTSADDGQVTRRTICQGLGDVVMLRGRYDEAADWFAQALDLTDDGLSRADISLRLGELAFKRGDVVESITHLESGLRSLGRRAPTGSLPLIARLLWEVLVQFAHCVLPRRWVSRRRREGADAPFLAARICSRLAYSYWFARGKVPTAWAHLREMNILERYPPSLELAQAYSEHAPVATTLPWYSRGIAYVERSLEIRRAAGDVWGQGQSLSFYGVVLYSASRFEEAIEKFTQAIRLLERTGDQWEINTARWHIAFAQYRLGRLSDAVETCEHVYRDGAAIGDHHATGISLGGWSKASVGRVPPELVTAEMERGTDDVHTTAELHLAEGIRLLAEEQPAEAVEVFRAGQRRVAEAGLRTEYVAPLPAWIATAMRRQAEGLSPYAAAEREQLLRQARRQARRAYRLARFYRNNVPHVLRERALLAALGGRRAQATRLLRRSVLVAAELGMEAERQESTRRLSLLQDTEPTDRTAVGVPTEHDAYATTAPEPTLSLLDRFDGVLRAGRAIASSLTPVSVYAAARSAMIELLRGQDCTVLLVQQGSDGHFHIAGGDDSSGSELVTQLALRALTSGLPELLDEADVASGAIDPGLHPERSALIAPVWVRGRPVACLYTGHRQLRGLFGHEELRLAEFVATVAGAALENAEGFAEVEALTHSLEQRVEERTQELTTTNDALRVALDELQRVNDQLRVVDELKSDFVAMVSHELKSPLTSILGYCSMLLRRWDDVTVEQRFNFVEVIEQQAQRLSKLVHDLLEMSHIESGHLDTRPQPVRLRELVHHVANSYATPLDGLIIDIADAVRAVADPEHLQRVVINLLDNAYKYGAAPVSVTASVADGQVRLVVADAGDGVPEEFRPRLFEKFAQASSGPTRQSGSTGLGLSIVRGLAQAMHGEVSFEPGDPTGSKFIVLLPAAD
jgi:signal transduction histidine kinase/serine/threonine protein kinase/tetratricopeptide (TPR) repeat protein